MKDDDGVHELGASRRACWWIPSNWSIPFRVAALIRLMDVGKNMSFTFSAVGCNDVLFVKTPVIDVASKCQHAERRFCLREFRFVFVRCIVRRRVPLVPSCGETVSVGGARIAQGWTKNRVPVTGTTGTRGLRLRG